jgi:hypothetical protein
MDPQAPQQPTIRHVELREPIIQDGRKTRMAFTINEGLTKVLGLKGVVAEYWASVIMTSILVIFNQSSNFWEHIQVTSRFFWDMEQSVRRDLGGDDARLFVSNRKDLLEKAILSRGTDFAEEFSYIYTWMEKYHNYVLDSDNAIFCDVFVPSDESMWLVTFQLYPRIFLQESEILWRKGGIKFEKLIRSDDIQTPWVRTLDTRQNAQKMEVAWYAADRADTLFVPAKIKSGIYEMVNSEIILSSK